MLTMKKLLMKTIKKIRSKYPQAAFLIGNGPNLSAHIFPSWKELLIAAADGGKKFDIEGLTNTEVYDLVELHAADSKLVKQRVCNELEFKTSMDTAIHQRLMEYAVLTKSPVLTTNFDAAFETAIGADLLHIESKDFTRFYPWKSYYGFDKHQLPTAGFGIWKIHGDVHYKDSIRLGLTDYMGSVERARKLIHKGDDRLFQGKQQDFWGGFQTWLHIWFNLPIIIFGFGYDTDEIFLRWLLIERKRYLNLTASPMEVWYLTTSPLKPSVKNFMENLDVKFIKVDKYSDLYG